MWRVFKGKVFSQHPQIQKKSQYIKYLCCEDVRTLHQWVNGIRIAKVTITSLIICVHACVIFCVSVRRRTVRRGLWI